MHSYPPIPNPDKNITIKNIYILGENPKHIKEIEPIVRPVINTLRLPYLSEKKLIINAETP